MATPMQLTSEELQKELPKIQSLLQTIVLPKKELDMVADENENDATTYIRSPKIFADYYNNLIHCWESFRFFLKKVVKHPYFDR